jgi:hydrogenase expression/formation protein HypE
VRSLCEVLGLDPFYLACEGRLVAVVDGESAEVVLTAMRKTPVAAASCVVGRASARCSGQVVVETPLGTHRLLQMLSGEQLPRIC